MADVAGLARLHGPPDMFVELKGLSITLHYRRTPRSVPGCRSGPARSPRPRASGSATPR